MLHNLTLRRPLAVLDLETTGLDTNTDRIVEISVLKFFPDGNRVHRTRRVNPEMPIPASATEVHGIRNEDVATEPNFKRFAKDLLVFLDGCDLCGYNLKRYDLRVLYRELERAGLKLNLEGRAIVDPQEIFFHYEPHTHNLIAAVRRYVGREHDGAHSAAADVLATAEVLDAMLGRYQDLPRSVDGIHEQFKDSNMVDSDGWFRSVEGELRFVKSKHRGEPLAFVVSSQPSFLNWMLGQDFVPNDTKAIVRDALHRFGGEGSALMPARSVS